MPNEYPKITTISRTEYLSQVTKHSRPVRHVYVQGYGWIYSGSVGTSIIVKAFWAILLFLIVVGISQYIWNGLTSL